MSKRHQVTCRCSAYRFPHRFGGGACDGMSIVIDRFPGSGCRTCHLNNNGCEVINGQEHPRECEYVIDFTHYHEVKL